MTFIWERDILTLYALLGLALPFFHRWSDRHLLLAAAFLILVVPIAGYAMVGVAGISPTFRLHDAGEAIFMALGGISGDNIYVAWLQREDWPSFLAWVLSGPPYRLGDFFETWRIPKVLGVMLIGLWAGRRLVVGQLLENRRLLKIVAAGGFAIGLPANWAYALVGGLAQDSFSAGLLATTLYALGVVPLGLAYAATFALLWKSAASLPSIFAAPGRMALTNYLMHSILGVLIFYGIGFGLIGRVPPWTIYAIAIAIFTGPGALLAHVARALRAGANGVALAARNVRQAKASQCRVSCVAHASWIPQ